MRSCLKCTAFQHIKSASKLRRSTRDEKRGPFEAPGWVMMRSLVVPGWGQLHNRAWLKAIGVATGEVWMGLRVLDDRSTLNRIEDDVSRIEDEMAGLDLSQHSETAYMLGGSASYGEYSMGGSSGGFEGMKPAEAKPRPSH